MNCTKCGSVLPEGAKFCGVCGQPAEMANMFCPVCGSAYSQGQRFCLNCGTQLQVQPPQNPYTQEPAPAGAPVQNGPWKNAGYAPNVYICKSPTVMWYMGLRGYEPPKSNGYLTLFSDRLEYKAVSKVGFFGDKGNAVYNFGEIANVAAGYYPEGASIVVTLMNGLQQTYGTNAAKAAELYAFLDQIHAAMGR